MSSLTAPRHPNGPRRRAALVVPALLALASLLGSACTGDDLGGTSTGTTEVPPVEADDPLSFTAYVDPAVPIEVAIGERFAIMLDAEPTQGCRWEVVSQGDPAVLLPLGSQFIDRDDPTVPTTTTTIAPPPPPETTPEGGDADAATTTIDCREADEEAAAPEPTTMATTTPAPTRALQVFSYVARGFGSTSVQLRYVRVGEEPTAETPVLSFNVGVPVPPELLPPPEDPAEGEAEADA